MTGAGRGARGLAAGGVLLFSTLTLPAALEARTSLVDRFELTLAGLSVSADSRARLALGGAPPAAVDFEDDLGVDDRSTTLTVELAARLGRRHQLALGDTAVDRSGLHTLEGSLPLGGITLPAGVSVETSVDVRRLGLTYTFWPYLGDRLALGVALGVVGTELSAEVTGRLRAGPLDLVAAERAEASAPLPEAGLELRAQPLPRLRLRAFGRFFSVGGIRGWSGSASDLGAAVEGRALRHLWLGAGYSSFQLDVRGAGDFERAKVDLGGVSGDARLAW